MGWDEAQLPALSGRTALVTGANSGIGWHTARQLAAHGARVLLACRDPDRGQDAVARITAEDPHASVEVLPLDLGDMASVRDCATTLVDRDEPLDVLINNAGVMAPPSRSYTVDGFERQFGTNHLGHFALTALLLPALNRSTEPRVVTVSSIAHFSAGRDVLDGNANGRYDSSRTYANSKLANLLFARELQRRSTAQGLALTSTAAHPGVSSTHLVASADGMGARWLVRTVGPVFVRTFGQSAADGARPTLYAATVAAPGSYTGPQHFRETRGPVGPARMSELARDDALARQLWDVSEELTGLRYPWRQTAEPQ